MFAAIATKVIIKMPTICQIVDTLSYLSNLPGAPTIG